MKINKLNESVKESSVLSSKCVSHTKIKMKNMFITCRVLMKSILRWLVVNCRKMWFQERWQYNILNSNIHSYSFIFVLFGSNNSQIPKTEDLCLWKISEYRRPKIFANEKFSKTEDWRSSLMKYFRRPKTE